jgi:hypothetical protein
MSSSQRPLLGNTQHLQKTDIHAPCGIRTHSLSRRAAADLRIRPPGHWDRQAIRLPIHNLIVTTFNLEKSMNTIVTSPVDVTKVLKHEVSKNKGKNCVPKMRLA